MLRCLLLPFIVPSHFELLPKTEFWEGARACAGVGPSDFERSDRAEPISEGGESGAVDTAEKGPYKVRI